MQKMDNPINDEAGAEPEIIQAEVVEVEPGTPWEWREVRRRAARGRARWRLPAVLFVATCLSTLLVGTQIGDRQADWLAAWLAGLRYAVPRDDDSAVPRDGPFPSGPPLRRLCQPALLHPHARSRRSAPSAR